MTSKLDVKQFTKSTKYLSKELLIMVQMIIGSKTFLQREREKERDIEKEREIEKERKKERERERERVRERESLKRRRFLNVLS